PRIKIEVPNTLQEEGKASLLSVDLKMRSMEDFEPARVARQIPELAQLLEARDRLANMLSQMELKPKFADALSEIIRETERRKGESDESAQQPSSSQKEGPDR